MKISLLFTLCLCLVVNAVVQAAPLVKRIVVDPKITSPNISTTWIVGDKTLVTWDTSEIPEPKNFTGTILLGFMANSSENLMLDSPLADGFLLTDGQVQVTVPDVPPRNDYIVVLLGDSGNASDEFDISGGSASASSSSPTPSSTQPPSETSSPTSGSVSSAAPSLIAPSSAAVGSNSTPTRTSVALQPSPSSIDSSAPASSSASPSPKSGGSNSGASPRYINAWLLSTLAGTAFMALW